MKQHPPDEPLFRFLDFDAGEMHDHSTAIADMHQGVINGLIMRNVYSPESVAAVVDRLERGEPRMTRKTFMESQYPEAPPYVLGQSIVTAEPDLRGYLAVADQYRRDCRALFRDLPDFEARMEEIFAALGGGLPVHVPAGPEPGQTYTSSTGRVLPDGCGIRTHVGNSFLEMPQARHLSGMVEMGHQFSYFVTLSAPPSGGELVVYALEWDDVRNQFVDNDAAIKQYGVNPQGDAARWVESHESMAVKPGPGDLLMFDGGRYYHGVTAPGGGPRRTIGGFLAYARDHESIYYWS